MDGKTPITLEELNVGRKLPWNIYNESGKLLLGVGQAIPSEQFRENLRLYDLYRDSNDSDYGGGTGVPVNPFSEIEGFILQLDKIYQATQAGDNKAVGMIGLLVKNIITMCEKAPDASIALLHLANNYPYILFHSMQGAIICALLGRYGKLSKQDTQILCIAALVADVSIYGKVELKDDNEELALHPQQSVDMLRAVGVENQVLCDTILMHHERADGSGYPAGLKQEQITRNALMLAVADHYSDMIAHYDPGKSVSVNDSLKIFLLDKGQQYDQHFALLLIKVLTVFPPGSFVKLKNDEIAIVIRRGNVNPMEPVIRSVVGSDGRCFPNPPLRDCSTGTYQITGTYGYDMDEPLNPGKLWEFA